MQIKSIDFAPIPLDFKPHFEQSKREFYEEESQHIKGRLNKALYKMGLATIIGITKEVPRQRTRAEIIAAARGVN